jgi:hypothetical protein
MDIGGLLQMLMGGMMGGGGGGGGGGQGLGKGGTPIDWSKVQPSQQPVQNVGQPSGWAQFGQGMQNAFAGGWGHNTGAATAPTRAATTGGGGGGGGGGMGMDQLMLLLQLLQGGGGARAGMGSGSMYAPTVRDSMGPVSQGVRV